MTSDNKLITTSPAGPLFGSVYTGRGLVASAGNCGAWHDGAWDGGTGITTSDSRAINTNDLTILAVTRAGDFGKIAFAGQSVKASDTIVMFIWGGDANLDGKIDIDGYGIIDFDVTSQMGTFLTGGSVTSVTLGGVASVPESCCAMLAFGAFSLLARRTRH